MIVRLADLTRDRVEELAADSLAVLPTASIEQHGPHLPVGVWHPSRRASVAGAATALAACTLPAPPARTRRRQLA
ncbi:MAG: creatininase family protein [Spirochaetaceae bacterium]|nr:creatininase family protein [Spirochaetaceae bacterium]